MDLELDRMALIDLGQLPMIIQELFLFVSKFKARLLEM